MTATFHLRERFADWKRQAKANERRWMMAHALKWAADTTTTEAELVAEIRDILTRYGWSV